MENEERKNNSLDDGFEDIEETLDSGIYALDMGYLRDKRVNKLVEIFKKSIYFIKTHTTLTEEQIIDKINKNIMDVELKDGYEDNPNGIGYVDAIFNILSINVKVLEIEPNEVYKFIKHEITHMLGIAFERRPFRKEPVLISGYSREIISAKNMEKVENESFNEAAVEMFIYQDEEYEEQKIFGEIPINTNQDFNEGYYCVNSNLIHQMILARGIEEQEFFEGLYNKGKAQKNIGKFPRRLFKKISKNMDRITDDIDAYYDADDRIYDMKQKGEKGPFEQDEKQKSRARENFIKRVSKSERIIIDKLLVPRLKKVPINERQTLLDKYFQFIICEKEYFKQRTGYQMIEKNKKTDNPLFKHFDVEPLTQQKQEDRITENDIEKDFEK